MRVYGDKLNKVCTAIEKMSGTAEARTLSAVAMDLEGDVPIGEMLHSLDREHFNMVIELLVEFRVTGRRESFNSIHSAARKRISKE